MMNWRVVMMGLAWLLFAFGLLQMYDMSVSVVAKNYGRALIDGIGGGLIMFSSFLIYNREASE
jgi:hypothetical protein